MIAALAGLILVVLYLAIALFFIIAYWKVYVKAGQPGWGVLIPIYNLYLWVKIAGKPGWWLLLCLIPIVNIVIAIILALEITKAFGKSTGFAILLILLPIIAVPILGFGSAVYTKPAGAAA
jgi:hypothetical protein